MLGFLAILIGQTALVEAAKPIKYDQWNSILQKYVNEDGLVDYAGLKANRGEFDQFIKQIEEADITSMSKDAQKTFWINAYNALTIKLIIDRYPLKFGGIRTINFGRPWSVKMKATKNKLTLGDIEHEILRKWDPIDPRIHFAINCASIGCPLLRNTTFEPKKINLQLDYEAKRFINDPRKVRLDRSKNILYYSAIFKWFKEDFLVEDKDLVSYIKRYINQSDREYLDENKVKLKTLKYGWGLNKQ